MLGPLAALAAVVALVRFRSRLDPGLDFVLWWAAGLLVVFSFTPISLAPFQFITKQSNYLNLFLAPLTLLAAWLLSQWSLRWCLAVLLPLALLSVVLAGLKQQDRRAFVSNSRAVIAFAQANPEAEVYGSVNNRNMHTFYMRLGEPLPTVRTLAELTPRGEANARVFAVFDPVTQGWSPRDVALEEVPACWSPYTTLDPTGFGVGHDIALAIATLTGAMPKPIAEKAAGLLQDLVAPKPAQVYAVPADNPWCEG